MSVLRQPRYPDANEERDRFGRMRTEFAGSGMVGQYGDSNGFLPILHSLVDRTYGTAVQILNRHNLQGDISFVTGLITGLDMQVDKSSVRNASRAAATLFS